MSIQTNVFENGRWVTRTMDPYHVRAQNTRCEEEKNASTSTRPERAPSLGLLTRTLVGSSVTKWIIPARIRHKTKNDVLFISTDCVAIKEAWGNYSLTNVAVKNDFDSPIRAAKILGDPRECHKGDKYNDAQRHSMTFALKRGALTGEIFGEWPTRGGEGQNPGNVAQHLRELPPHVLVLALESSKLVFMCAVNGPSDQPQLLTSQHPLPVSKSSNERLGRHIATDPKSRAMAVTAHEGVMYVYALKSMKLMQEQLSQGLGLNPIKEERLVPIQGSVLNVEFLHPTHNDPDQIILLLIVSRQKKSRMIWYDWNSASTLRETQLQPTSCALPYEESLPLLLIPLINYTTFMLVCQKTITIYKDLLAGSPTRYVQQLENEERPEEPGSARSTMLWTQWARPMRAEGHRFTHVEDSIYLCREDGIVQYLEFHNDKNHVLNSTHQAGKLGSKVDTAFAILDVGPSTLDLIVAGGDGSEGGVWRVEPRTDKPLLLDAIANWAPLNDVAIVTDSDEERSFFGGLAETGLAYQLPQRIFACTGKGKHGAISELRYGVQASKLLPAGGVFTLTDEIRDEIRSGVVNIWAFHGYFGDTEYQDFQGLEEKLKDVTYVFISHPTRTSLLFLPLEQDPALVEDAGLDLYTSTIFAGFTASRHLIQVTETSIILAFMSPPQVYVNDEGKIAFRYQGVNTRYVYQIPDHLCRILTACLHSDDNASLLLIAGQRNEQFYLELAHIDTRYEPRGEPCLLHARASCVHLYRAGQALLALVATVDCNIQVFVVSERGLIPSTTPPYTFLSGTFAICDSIAILTSNREVNVVQQLIVCGLRNGSVQTLHCTGEGCTFDLVLCEERVFGATSVTVITDTTRKSRVICHCERSFCTLEYTKQLLYAAPATICNIWMTDRDQPAFTQGTLSIISQAVQSWLPKRVPGLAFGALIGIDGDSLHVLKLNTDPEARMVQHRLTIGRTTKRVIYSRVLDKLIVLHEGPMSSKDPQRNRSRNVPGERTWQPSITFLNPDTTAGARLHLQPTDVKQEDQPNGIDGLPASKRKKTERFLAITEWFPAIDGQVWHYLVIGTELTHHSTQKGRLLLIRTGNRGNEKPNVELRRSINLSAPVYYVAAYPDRKSIVYCSGRQLCLQTVDVAGPDLKLQALVKVEMRSPATYLSIKAPYIFVSSSGESLSVYKYEDGKLIYQYGDQSARYGLHHVHAPEHSLVLASDMGNTVVGLWQPPERRVDNAMTPVFEAILPGSINRLGRVTRPLWYRDLNSPHDDHSIIGTSIDGTITQFDILAKGWRLLRFLQNMAERNEVVCPFRSSGPYKRHIDPSDSRPHYMHINGDILQRVVERGGERLVKEMLDVEPDLDSHTDFDTVEARWERFRELAAEVVDTGSEDWLAGVVQWVRYQLLSAL